MAAALTVALVRLTGHPYEVYGALAAVLVVAPSTSQTLRTALSTVGVNVLGGLIGASAVLLFGPHPVVIGAVTISVLWLCQQAGWSHLSLAAITVTLFVMSPHEDGTLTYVLWRLVSVMTGTVTGVLVNTLILPPDQWYGRAEALLRIWRMRRLSQPKRNRYRSPITT